MLGEFGLRLGDAANPLALMLGDEHRFSEQLARLQLRRQSDSELSNAHFLSERNAVVLAERASGFRSRFRQRVELLHLVAPIGESGDALLFREFLAGGEQSGEREGELFGIHGCVWVGCWVSLGTLVVYIGCGWKLGERVGF